MGIPWTDEYFSLQKESKEFTELNLQHQDAMARSQKLNAIGSQLVSRLTEIKSGAVIDDNVEELEEQLIELVRISRARLRHIETSLGTQRPWATQGDSPLASTMPEYAYESEYDLQKHTVELRADGTLNAIHAVVQGIVSHGWLMTTESMAITPTGSAASPVALEVRFTVYGLSRRPEDPELDVAWWDGASDESHETPEAGLLCGGRGLGRRIANAAWVPDALRS
ncbi:MAG: hypothetical protein AAGA03_09985 [Planctomycetota bacterium]